MNHLLPESSRRRRRQQSTKGGGQQQQQQQKITSIIAGVGNTTTTTKRSNITTTTTSITKKCTLSTFILYGLIVTMITYSVIAIVALKRNTTTAAGAAVDGRYNYLRPPPSSPQNNNNNKNNNKNRNDSKAAVVAAAGGGGGGTEQANNFFAPGRKPWGLGVKPEEIGSTDDHPIKQKKDQTTTSSSTSSTRRILTAYFEPPMMDDSNNNNNKRPLQVRTWTSEDLKKRTFPKLNSCSKLIEQWPVDDYPDDDPFLPWIHDVFPDHEGKFIQFVAQNKRRCKTGTKPEDYKTLKEMEPQISLFQHVPIKRVQHAVVDDNNNNNNNNNNKEQLYRLASHEDADPDGIATRFLCRFSSSIPPDSDNNGQEQQQQQYYYETTFSVFNFDYEWASHRKHQKVMFHEHGRDNKQVHTSQLLFKCPVPARLQEVVRTGSSVIDDYATIFVDLVPIRTPPRYGKPGEFLQPYYTKGKKESTNEKMRDTVTFDPDKEWGTNHILPTIENSGRWANIPICKPSLMTYDSSNNNNEDTMITTKEQDENNNNSVEMKKKHRLVSCLWASAGYATRGNRFAINDGQRRLLEWITYKHLIGVEHFYLYDNSAAFSDQVSLKSIVDMFPPGLITVIDWPARVCNNNPNNVDSGKFLV